MYGLLDGDRVRAYPRPAVQPLSITITTDWGKTDAKWTIVPARRPAISRTVSVVAAVLAKQVLGANRQAGDEEIAAAIP